MGIVEMDFKRILPMHYFLFTSDPSPSEYAYFFVQTFQTTISCINMFRPKATKICQITPFEKQKPDITCLSASNLRYCSYTDMKTVMRMS